jgi:hypothetical protein
MSREDSGAGRRVIREKEGREQEGKRGERRGGRGRLDDMSWVEVVTQSRNVKRERKRGKKRKEEEGKEKGGNNTSVIKPRSHSPMV